MTSLFDQGPSAPCPTPFNMAAYVLAHADRYATKSALEVLGSGGATLWTYAQLRDRVARCAGGLRAAGLRPGERVLLRLGNSAEFPVAYLGCIWAGLVPVPTSTQLTVPEISVIAQETTPAAVLRGDDVSLPNPCPCPVFAMLPDADPIAPDMGDPNRLAYIIYTSGTSGRPRGVRHAHRAIWARRMMWDGWYGLRAQDRVMHAGAFNWTYTLGTGLMDPWSIGATALIPAPGLGAAGLAQLCADACASIFAAAPGVYRQMLKRPLPPMLSLRHGLSAGEALPVRVRDAWQEATGCALYEALGMSECSTFISASPAHPAGDGSSGRPQKGRKVAVLKDGVPVPYGAPGLLAIAGDDPGLMLGYLDAPDLDVAWFVTGDTVSMNAEGDIVYLGRADDMMNAGGYRVSPLEVEAAFASLDGVPECAATAVEIKRDAQVIALFYTGPVPLPDDVMRAHAQGLLAKYKQPRLYIHRKALPKGANGKLNRRFLRADFEVPNI